MSNQKIFTAVALLILVCLGAEVVVLASQNSRLRAAVNTLTEMQRPRTLSTGSEVPTLDLEPVAGIPSALSFEKDLPTLVFVFTTSCPSCKKTIPLWTRLFENLSGCTRILGISGEPIERIAEYQKDINPPYDLFAVSQDLLLDRYRISVVPQTLLLGDSGIVLGVWPGELTPSDVENIERLINRHYHPTHPCRSGV